MSDAHSVTKLIHQLEDGDSIAAKEIWDRFIFRLIGLARKRLQNLPRRAVDEEDVAVSAFNAFFQGVDQNRFERLRDRDDLWQVLAMLAERKAIGVMRHELAEKRGGGVHRGESVFDRMIAESASERGIQQVADPSPQAVDGFTAGVREMLESLSDSTAQRIALLKLEGLTNQEIAGDLGISLRAVERKLSMIRQRWERM
jgi:DNA-directed RNA polymerase specialized sigma24 family protein